MSYGIKYAVQETNLHNRKKSHKSLDHLKMYPILVWTLIEHSPAATSQTLGSAWIFAKFPKFPCVRKKKIYCFSGPNFKKIKN